MSVGKWWLGIVCCLGYGPLAIGQHSSPVEVDQQPAINDQQDNRRDQSVGDARAPQSSTETEGQIFTVRPDAMETRHIFDVAAGDMTTIQDGVAGGGDALSGTVVYSNRPDLDFFFAPSPSFAISDDLSVIAVGGCDLSGIELRFSGGGDGSGQGFDVDFALYDDCPDNGGVPIAGTEQSLTFYNDGVHLVLLDLSDAPVTIPKTVWMRFAFSRDGAGVSIGAPATIGYSEDRFSVFVLPCQARLAGTGLYSAFHAQLHCDSTIEREFLTYLSAGGPSGAVLSGFENWWITDDVQLSVDSCMMTSFQISTLSDAGPYSVEAELWRELNPNTAIPGTHANALGKGNGFPEVIRFDFPDGVPLPVSSFLVAWKYDDSEVKTTMRGETVLGYSDPSNFCLWQASYGPYCYYQNFSQLPGFRIAVRCAGDEPHGACCDVVPALGSSYEPAVCESRTQINCLGSFRRWVPDVACPGTCLHTNDPCTSDDDCRLCSESKTGCGSDSDCPSGESCESGDTCGTVDPFTPPCGFHACCTPPESPYGEGCVNLPRDQCEALVDDEGNQGDWHANRYCGVNFDCPRWACRHSDAFCDAQHAGVGCVDVDLCQAVCEMDSWCCDVAWDRVCQRHACEQDAPPCHPTCIIWASPANHTFDARQPHPPGDPTNIFTPRWIDVSNGPGMCADCWSANDSAAGGEDIDVTEIEWINTTDRRIHFNDHLPWPARTYVSYWGNGGECDSEFRVTYSPGNVNADGAADLADIEDYIAYLTDGDPWLAFPYRCDIDRSGACNPADLLRLIDLLNGAASFEPMLGVPIGP